jgi:hypothetical protein
MKNEFSLQISEKNTKISDFMKIHPVGVELFHADRWVYHVTGLVVTVRIFAKAHKKITVMIVDALHFCQIRVITEHSCLILYFRSMLTPHVEEIFGSPVRTSV